MHGKIQKYIQKIADYIPLKTCLNFNGLQYVLPYYHTVCEIAPPHLAELGFFRKELIFQGDIQFFKNNFEVAGINNFTTKKNSFHISFDDGLAENFSFVAPFLKEQNINATFFINSDFIDNKKMFYKHKLSVVLNALKSSQQNIEAVCLELNCNADQVDHVLKKIKDEKKIDHIAKTMDINFEEYLNEEKPYLTTKELIELQKMGFTIANHSKSHQRFSALNFEEQKLEVDATQDFLRKAISPEKSYFCFPFGDDDVDQNFFNWMNKDAGFQKSFGTAGIKKDHYSNHFHRILMEEKDFTAEQIIKYQCTYYFLKSFLNKNSIRR